MCPKCRSTDTDVCGEPRHVIGAGTLPDGRAYTALRITVRRCNGCHQRFTERQPDTTEEAVPVGTAREPGRRRGARR